MSGSDTRAKLFVPGLVSNRYYKQGYQRVMRSLHLNKLYSSVALLALIYSAGKIAYSYQISPNIISFYLKLPNITLIRLYNIRKPSSTVICRTEGQYAKRVTYLKSACQDLQNGTDCNNF
jgi:hypothetical protein